MDIIMRETDKFPRLDPMKKSVPIDDAEENAPSLRAQVANLVKSKTGIAVFGLIFITIFLSVCFQSERLLRAGVYDFFKMLGNEGFGVSYNIDSSYFFLRSGVDLDDIVVTAPEKAGGWVLRTGRLTVSASPFSARDITIKINGTQSLSTKETGDMRFVIANGEVALHLRSSKDPFSAKITFKDVQTASPRSMQGLSVSDVLLTLNRGISGEKGDAPLDFSLILNAVRLPARKNSHLPRLIEYVKLDGALSATPEDDRPFLSGWIYNGGTADVSHGEVIWEPFMTSFSGTFALNAAFEPMGAVVAKTYGLFDLLEILELDQVVRTSRASVARVVLGDRMTHENGEKHPSVTSPFSYQSGKVYAGELLLFDKNEK